MAHANIFERITTSDKKEGSMHKKALETIKILGEQVIEIRKIIEKKDRVIDELKTEITALQNQQSDTNANIKLLTIDQRDMNKQLRGVRAAVRGREFAQAASPEVEDFSQRVVERYQPHRIEQPAPNPTMAETPKQSPKAAPVSAQAHESSPAEMDRAYHTISDAINTARVKLGLDPHEDLPGTIHEQNRIYSQVQEQAQKPAKSAEQAVKEFTFGRIPRLLDL